MPPKKATRPPVQFDEVGEQEVSPKLGQRHDQPAKKGKAEKRKNLLETFDAEIMDAEKAVQQLLQQVSETSDNLRAKKISRLKELFEKRGKIEAEIFHHSKILDQAYSIANRELKEVLKGKNQDIDDIPVEVRSGESH